VRVQQGGKGLVIALVGNGRQVEATADISPIGAAEAMAKVVADFHGLVRPDRVAVVMHELDGERVVTLLLRRDRNRPSRSRWPARCSTTPSTSPPRPHCARSNRADFVSPSEPWSGNLPVRKEERARSPRPQREPRASVGRERSTGTGARDQRQGRSPSSTATRCGAPSEPPCRRRPWFASPPSSTSRISATFPSPGGRCSAAIRTAASTAPGPPRASTTSYPKSRGGQHTWDNVVACCRRCNVRKGSRLPAEAGLTLASVPTAPRHHGWIYASAGYSLDPAWHRYLAEIA
jgi:hypothetical protein